MEVSVLAFMNFGVFMFMNLKVIDIEVFDTHPKLTGPVVRTASQLFISIRGSPDLSCETFLVKKPTPVLYTSACRRY